MYRENAFRRQKEDLMCDMVFACTLSCVYVFGSTMWARFSKWHWEGNRNQRKTDWLWSIEDVNGAAIPKNSKDITKVMHVYQLIRFLFVLFATFMNYFMEMHLNVKEAEHLKSRINDGNIYSFRFLVSIWMQNQKSIK